MSEPTLAARAAAVSAAIEATKTDLRHALLDARDTSQHRQRLSDLENELAGVGAAVAAADADRERQEAAWLENISDQTATDAGSLLRNRLAMLMPPPMPVVRR